MQASRKFTCVSVLRCRSSGEQMCVSVCFIESVFERTCEHALVLQVTALPLRM